MMFGWKMGPSLACGDTIIIKTSSMTCLLALKVAALVKEASFPPGVVNIITCPGGIIGDALDKHMKVVKVSFTDSITVGHSIVKAAAESNMKKVTLKLGGKPASIIFDDADLENAVKWSLKGIFFNDGQVCCAGSRIYVQDMSIVKGKIFGPVAAVSKFSTLEEVVEKAKNSCYGLAAAVYSKDSVRAIKIADQLEAGTVWVNCHNKLD